jgi:hypothetical protein
MRIIFHFFQPFFTYNKINLKTQRKPAKRLSFSRRKRPCLPQGSSIYFFQSIMAHFLRLRRKKPGYPGVPPALRAGRSAPLLSLARPGYFALCAIKFYKVTFALKPFQNFLKTPCHKYTNIVYF